MTRDILQRRAGWLWMAMAVVLFLSGQRLRAAISADETVLLYPAMARSVPGGWEVEWQGSIFEAESRGVTTFALRGLLGLGGVEMTDAEEKIFQERSRLFLVDNERWKAIRVQWGRQSWKLGRSGANGRFASRQFLGSNQIAAARMASSQEIHLPLRLEDSGGRMVDGEVHLVTARGLSVVSDIDDTIKVSEVRDHDALLRNTFCRPFAPVAGMADTYRGWARQQNAVFHYVSASPWQLYLPLSEFIRSNAFPAGTFHLKEFRLKDRTALDLLASPQSYKLSVIEPILRRFPGRQFVLVGDSGEQDPEVYATLMRRYPEQVLLILIRDVTGETEDSERHRRIFRGLARDRWRVFREAGEIRAALSEMKRLPPKHD